MFPSVLRIFEFDLYTYMYCLLFSTPGIHRSKEALVPFRKEWCIETMIQVLGFYGFWAFCCVFPLGKSTHTTTLPPKSRKQNKTNFWFLLASSLYLPSFSSQLSLGIKSLTKYWHIWMKTLNPWPQWPRVWRESMSFLSHCIPSAEMGHKKLFGGLLGKKRTAGDHFLVRCFPGAWGRGGISSNTNIIWILKHYV